MLILPPTNHSACGGSHFSTSSQRLNQSNSSAIRAQKLSGDSCASFLRLSNSSRDLICAPLEKLAGGGKTRFSCKIDSMLFVADDIDRWKLLKLDSFGDSLDERPERMPSVYHRKTLVHNAGRLIRESWSSFSAS